MIEVTAAVDIDRPAEQVFDYLSDMANNPKWQKGMQECRWTSDPPLRVGSTYDQVAKFLGKEILSSFEVTELDPGRRVRIQTTSGSMPLDITRSVEPRGDDRTAVSANIKGDPSGLFRIAAPLMRFMVQRSVNKDYRRLKVLLEGSPTPA